MAHGFRIKRSWDRVGADLIAAFRELPVANVSDSMSRLSAFGHELRPMHASGMLAGPALTVRSRPGDNLMLHKAIDMAEPGDVIVMDAGGGAPVTKAGQPDRFRQIGIDDAASEADAQRRRRGGPWPDDDGEIGVRIQVAHVPQGVGERHGDEPGEDHQTATQPAAKARSHGRALWLRPAGA